MDKENKIEFTFFFNSFYKYREHFQILLLCKFKEIEEKDIKDIRKHITIPFHKAKDTLHLLCEILQVSLYPFPKNYTLKKNNIKIYINSIFHKINIRKNKEFPHNEIFSSFLELLIGTTKSICYHIVDNDLFFFSNNITYFNSRKSEIEENLDIIQDIIYLPKTSINLLTNYLLQFSNNYSNYPPYHEFLKTIGEILHDILTYLNKVIQKNLIID